MILPSKELLSAVFGKKIGKIETKGVYLEYEHWENCINHQKQDISGYDITRINIYELAFRVRDYFKDRYNYELPMNGKVEEIFTKAAQLHESML